MDPKEWFEQLQRMQTVMHQQQQPTYMSLPMQMPWQMQMQLPLQMQMQMQPSQMQMQMPLPLPMPLRMPLQMGMPLPMQLPQVPLEMAAAPGSVFTYERVTVSMPTQSAPVKKVESARAAIVDELNQSIEMEYANEIEEEMERKDDTEFEEEENKKDAAQVEKEEIRKDDKQVDVINSVNSVEENEEVGEPMSFDWKSTKPLKVVKKGKVAKKQTKKKIQANPRRQEPHDKTDRATDDKRRTTRSNRKPIEATEGDKISTIIQELQCVPGHMRAVSMLQEEHLKVEAIKIIDIVKSEECRRHLAQIARGEIVRDAAMMMGGGLGPFNLFEDLQTQLLDLLEQFDVGANAKYTVLLPEAIIFSLMKIHNTSWTDARSMFAGYSAIVEPFEGN